MCGFFYGHKVWRNHDKARTRYDVWCCNHRYKGEQKCNTPILRENEIKMAFVGDLEILGRSGREYTDALWYELVEEVVIYEDRRADFCLPNGDKILVKL